MIKHRKNLIIFFLFFCICIITIFHSLIQIQQNKTRNSLSAKEKTREERLDKLLSHYYGDYQLGNYSVMGWDGIDDRYLQVNCAIAPICAVVTVTEGMEDLMGERYLLSCYNQHYGTEETELTREQKSMLLRENPSYLTSWLHGGKMTMEVQEYLYDRTGEYKSELSVKIKAYTPYGDYFRACTGMKLVCFFGISDQGDQELYSTSARYGYFVTEGNYLVPMVLTLFEDIVRYRGMSLKEYKELIQDYYDLSEKRWAILRYMGETIAKPEEGYREGISLILEEKKKGRKKELYVLASARKLGEEDRVTKMGRLLLEEEGERYVVTEGSWDKDGTEESGKVEFPKRIYKLAREYGYPEGDCVSKIEEEMPYTPIKRP